MKILFSILASLLILSVNAQSGLTVHEWGTFTARYTGYGTPYLDVHKTIDEKVPDFVHHIDFENCDIKCTDYYKEAYWYVNRKLSLENISIKMETPVLYFYSKQEIKDLEINVDFPKGSISEFYPLPLKHEDLNHVISKVTFKPKFLGGLSPENFPFLTFGNYNGFAKWKINVLAPDNPALPSKPDESVPNVWLAPRKTASNLIESNQEREKYIFYRGLGSFTNPLIPEYTKNHNLLVTNKTEEILKYVMVYEMTKDGRRYIWGEKDIQAKGSVVFPSNIKFVDDYKWNTTYKPKFIEALVEAGLYKDEAEAMLNTWNQSYFEKPGIKIFWITPRKFTDEILPISFSLKPDKLERVMIGRTEIDEFNPSEISKYLNESVLPKLGNYTFYPNPSRGELFLSTSNSEIESVKIEIIDFLGRTIKIIDYEIQPFTENRVPVENISKGIYFVKLNTEKSSNIYRIAFQ